VPLVAVATLLGSPGCATGTTTIVDQGFEQSLQPAQADGRAHSNGFIVAEVKGSAITVHQRPDPAAGSSTLANPTDVGAPRVFLVMRGNGDNTWVHVLVPVRPNGSAGWVRADDVVLRSNPYGIRVELGRHRISVWRGPELVMREPVGVGRGALGTPKGVYFLTELLKPPDPTGPYGPYAFGTSAFSDVLTHFAGGNGVIGIHGTNEPDGIGKDVSHGCIRLRNEAITRLAGLLPLGTPVFITP
jgi:lipoprotein-anchoring transpeptidase ErfK/SrfK